jgi:hypothetical protein
MHISRKGTQEDTLAWVSVVRVASAFAHGLPVRRAFTECAHLFRLHHRLLSDGGRLSTADANANDGILLNYQTAELRSAFR